MPSDKCDSHDDCFKRLYAKVEGMDGKLDRIVENLRERLHDGDLRFKEFEMRLARCEEQLKASTSGRMDVKRKLTGGVIDLLKIAVMGIVGAALWAFANGYRG